MVTRSAGVGAALLLTAVVCAAAAAAVAAQSGAPGDDRRADVELTGCVSMTPAATGEFTFVDARTGGSYRLQGKGIRRYAGRRVALVKEAQKKGLKFRLGLWPSPNVAGRAGDLDPAQESIARQPGGGASMADTSNLPELRVERMRGVDGACG